MPSMMIAVVFPVLLLLVPLLLGALEARMLSPHKPTADGATADG